MENSLKLTRPEPTEAQVLNAVLACLERLQALGKVAWYSRMNTGAGKLQRGKDMSQFIRFGFKGCPDVLGQLCDGRALAIEVKRPSGRVSIEQAAFLEKSSKYHACAFVARSVDDVMEKFK